MIEDKFVDLYARNSGLRDKLVAERDVVLTYALRALLDTGVMDHLAFKGGTCLHKLIFGSAGRFSEDLDFTLDSDRRDDDVLTELVEVFNTEYHGITFTFNEYYKTDDDTSFGGQVLYSHRWNETGRFRLQVSLRERPTLPVVAGAMKQQAYFDHLEFDLFDVRSLEAIEMIAEKVRAAFQRDDCLACMTSDTHSLFTHCCGGTGRALMMSRRSCPISPPTWVTSPSSRSSTICTSSASSLALQAAALPSVTAPWLRLCPMPEEVPRER